MAFLTYFFIEFREGHDWLVTGLSTGFVGSFTTFSSFHLDTFKQLENGMNSQAIVYFVSSIFIGFLCAYLGMIVGKKVGRKLALKT